MVEDKSNEIPAARTLIEDRQLDDAMILTDALHTQGLSAREIVQDCGGDYLMTVKANQKGLFRRAALSLGRHWIAAQPDSRKATFNGFLGAMARHRSEQAFRMALCKHASWLP